MKNMHKLWKRFGVLLTAMLMVVLLLQSPVCAALASETPTNEMDGSKIERIKIEWITPDSTVANNGVATPNDIKNDSSFLFLATAGGDDLEMKYQFEVEFSGQFDYAPGDIKITIPAQVWHTRTYDADGNKLRTMGDGLRDKTPNAVALLATVNDGKITFVACCGKDAVARGIKAGDIIKNLAPICGGRGGGKPGYFQGSIPMKKAQITELLQRANF